MCRYGIRSRCQLHLIGSLGDDAVAGFYSFQYLHTLSVVSSHAYPLFLVALRIHLAVDEEAPLFFSQCCFGHCNYILHRSGEQVDFYE